VAAMQPPVNDPRNMSVATRRRGRCWSSITLAVVAAFAVLAVAAVLAAPGANARESASKVRTLATVRGVILAFDQDGSRLASLERPRKGCSAGAPGALVVRTVGGRRPVRIPSGLACGPPRLFALGGERLAGSSESDSGNTRYEWVSTFTLGDRRSRTVEQLVFSPDGEGAFVSDIAADGAVVVYGVLSWRQHPPDCWQIHPECHLELLGGRVNRIGHRSTPIPGSLPPAQLAVDGGRVAIVPARMEACACNASPAWSPDGRTIAFSTRRDGDWEVVTGPAGGQVTKATDNWTNENQVDWSPDGSRIAYASERSITVSNRDGTEARPIAAGFQPAWSPDGLRIAFHKLKVDGLWLVNPDGSEERRLTATPDREAAWSPDGKRLATTRLSTSVGWTVTVMEADGTGARTLAEGYQPSWSPDGESIVYTRHDRADEELRVIRADGTGDRSLTNNHVNDYSPDWSPDGSRIVFVRGPLLEKEGKAEVYTVSPRGGSEIRLTTTRPVEAPVPVEIRTVSGKLVSRLLPHANPYEVALSADVAATLSRTKRAARLELFEPRSGRKVGLASLPRNSGRLSAAGKTVVYSTGRRIWALDAETRRQRLLATAAADPVGLSIEGRRVAWAESLKTTARIRAVLVP
jgi:TolB protein